MASPRNGWGSGRWSDLRRAEPRQGPANFGGLGTWLDSWLGGGTPQYAGAGQPLAGRGGDDTPVYRPAPAPPTSSTGDNASSPSVAPTTNRAPRS